MNEVIDLLSDLEAACVYDLPRLQDRATVILKRIPDTFDLCEDKHEPDAHARALPALIEAARALKLATSEYRHPDLPGILKATGDVVSALRIVDGEKP